MNTRWRGQKRKLLVHAQPERSPECLGSDDREAGDGDPMVDKLTWATCINPPTWTPDLLSNNEVTRRRRPIYPRLSPPGIPAVLGRRRLGLAMSAYSIAASPESRAARTSPRNHVPARSNCAAFFPARGRRTRRTTSSISPRWQRHLPQGHRALSRPPHSASPR